MKVNRLGSALYNYLSTPSSTGAVRRDPPITA